MSNNKHDQVSFRRLVSRTVELEARDRRINSSAFVSGFQVGVGSDPVGSWPAAACWVMILSVALSRLSDHSGIPLMEG